MDVQVKTCGKKVSLGQGPDSICGEKWGESVIQCDFCKGWDASRAELRVKLPHLYPFYRQEVCKALDTAGVPYV